MKQLRAEGIEKLLAALRGDCQHLERLSRDDPKVVECLSAAQAKLVAAEILVREERASA